MNFRLVPLVERLVSAMGIKAGRVPHQTTTLTTLFDLGFMGQGRGRETQLKADVTSGWLFAVIDRIATSVMAVEWSLFESKGGEKIETHPLLDLWDKPNPFWTRESFLELSMGYFDLVGEMWWLVVRSESPQFQPTELWALRPDRMRVISHPTKHIAGYEYRIGMEKVPLGVDDIIFTRRPSKWDAFRGVSPLQAIMFDIEGEQFASRYYRNFFSNSAAPGGVLETPDTMDDDEFQRFIQEWRAQHQGASNAHRVAVLEGGVKWVDVKQASGRDMQMVESRKYNRDIVFGAYGIPASVMGITENVNMANAQSGQESFQRDTIKPRLVRIQASANRHLVPMFAMSDLMTTGTMPSSSLYFDFADPVPENRELNLREAVEGFNAGILTQNEGRELLGHETVPDGDEFKATSPPPAMGDTPIDTLIAASVKVEPVTLASITGGWHVLPDGKDAPDPDDPAYLVDAEARIRRGWEERLEAEAEAIADYLEPFFKGQDRILVKIEPADVEGYAWDEWMDLYGDEVIEELMEAFLGVLSEAVLGEGILEAELSRRAADYARQRGAALLQLDGDVNVVEFTRERVRQLVAQTIERGDSLGALRKALQDDVAFSKSRASTVARTETREALGEAQLQGAGLMGQNEKRWITQGDLSVDDPCTRNAGVGWIDRDATFPDGKQRVPQHPNCRCNNIYRTREVELSWVGRCASCQKVLQKSEGSAAQVMEGSWCPRCKEVATVSWRRERD